MNPGGKSAGGGTLWRRQIVHAALLSFALAGCAFIELRHELEEMDRFSTISGKIEQETPSHYPVAVALFSEERRSDRLIDTMLIDSGEFRFVARPGRYVIAAFEDTNDDFRYQPKEPAGYYGDPTPIVLEPGTNVMDIRIALRRDIVLLNSEGSNTAYEISGKRELPNLWAGRRNIGALAALDDRRFGRKFASMGNWKPVKFSREVGPGIFFLEPYDPSKTPVLFVHGNMDTPRAWDTIIENLDRSRFQPWLLSYATGLPIEVNAGYMYQALTELRLKHGFERLYLVAHSVGGLVSQAFIDRYRAGDARYLKLFMTLATPWGGHGFAQKGVDRAPAVVPVWRDIAPNSALLTALRKSHLPEDLSYQLLFSYRSGSSGAIATDGSVTVASQLDPAAQARAERIYGFETGHRGILSDNDVIRLLNDTLNQAHDGAG